MLTKATSHQLRAAHNLRTQGQWKELEGYLQGELARVLDLMVSCLEDAPLRQLQGRAKALSEFMTFVNDSTDVMEKAERPSGGTRGF